MSDRIEVSRAINNRLVPALRERGFAIKGGDGERWKEGCWFERSSLACTQVLLIGKDKFGHLIRMNISRSFPDMTTEYMDWVHMGMSLSNLEYRTSSELDSVLERVVSYLDSAILPWLEGPRDS